MNEVFPWMHIVRGRARKPSTQGSIEVSHKAFKAALVKWLDQKQFEECIFRKISDLQMKKFWREIFNGIAGVGTWAM